jgi:metal-dependent HD superfamily phosphatase/phosphodiesterase
VFQIDELLRPKLSGSGIQDYIQVEGHVTSEKKIVTCFNL